MRSSPPPPSPGLSRRTLLRAGAAGALAAPWIGRAAAATPEVINIAYFVETKPTMIAKGLGWFADEAKAKINWTEAGSGAEINTAMAAGSVDIGLAIGSSPTAAGISQRLGYKLIGMVDNIGPAEEMTVRKSANIHTPADFKGKKVATPFGSTSHFRLLGFLKLNGLSQRDVTVLDMRPDAIVAAWERGDIDAAYVWSPAKSKLLANGGEVYRTYDKLDAAGYVIADLIVARSKFLDAYPDAVTGLLRAYGRALDMWQTEPQKAAEIVGKQAGVSAEVAMADLKEYDFVPLKQQLSSQWLGRPGKPGRFADVLKTTADFLVEQHSIRSAPGVIAFQKATDTVPLSQAVG
ncbi:MAG TPA: ABC transporter substrate-binding protein [Acetobacteraceae bacterium]|nr:ABC transporter substrate-binding protein [Acetobacteraceae bacterium]